MYVKEYFLKFTQSLSELVELDMIDFDFILVMD